MKKTVLILLCAALLVSLCACAEKASEKKDKESREEAGEAVSAPSVWGKKLSLEEAEIPAAAYASGAERCVALSPDGRRFLMGTGVAPYLYDTETGKSIPLVPGDEETTELVRMLSLRISRNLTDEQITARQDALAAMSGPELTKEFFTDRGYILQPMHIHAYPADGNYMFLYHAGSGATLVLDCDSGSFYLTEAREAGQPCAVQKGKLLLRRSGPSVLNIRNLADGSTEQVDLALPDLFPNGNYVSAAAFLPDGRICAVVGDSRFDEAGVEHALAVCAPGGKAELICSLGICQSYRGPDVLIPTEDGFVNAFYNNAGFGEAAIRVALETKEARWLTVNDKGEMEVLDREAFEAKKEAGELPKRPLSFLGRMADGKTLLLQDLANGGDLLLCRPAEGAIQYVVRSAPLISYISGSRDNEYVYVAGLQKEPVFVRIKAE